MRESIAEKKRERKEITNKLPWPPPPMPPWKEYFMKLNHTNDEIFCVNIILIIHLMKRTNTRSLSHQIIQRIITKSINLLFSSVERYQGMYPTTQSIHEGWFILDGIIIIIYMMRVTIARSSSHQSIRSKIIINTIDPSFRFIEKYQRMHRIV